MLNYFAFIFTDRQEELQTLPVLDKDEKVFETYN